MTLNIVKMSLLATLLFSAVAGAANQLDPAPDLSVLASKTLQLEGINGARIVEIVEANKPFIFTYCRKDSPSLWRHEVMSDGQPDAWNVLRISKDQAVEADSVLCKSAT